MFMTSLGGASNCTSVCRAFGNWAGARSSNLLCAITGPALSPALSRDSLAPSRDREGADVFAGAGAAETGFRKTWGGCNSMSRTVYSPG